MKLIQSSGLFPKILFQYLNPLYVMNTLTNKEINQKTGCTSSKTPIGIKKIVNKTTIVSTTMNNLPYFFIVPLMFMLMSILDTFITINKKMEKIKKYSNTGRGSRTPRTPDSKSGDFANLPTPA